MAMFVSSRPVPVCGRLVAGRWRDVVHLSSLSVTCWRLVEKKKSRAASDEAAVVTILSILIRPAPMLMLMTGSTAPFPRPRKR